MNKVLKGAGVIAVLCTLAACSNIQEINIQDPSAITEAEKTIHFTSSMADTKVAFDDSFENNGNVFYPVFWTENDDAVMISLNYEYAVTAGVNVSETDETGRIKQVSFDASFSAVETVSPYRFYAVSPASALLWASADRSAVSVLVPANQTPTLKSVDENAMVIVSSSGSYETLPDNVDLKFTHITSYGKLVLKNLPVPDGANLTSVTLVCEEQPLTGSWYYKFGDGSIEKKEASSSIVLNTENIDVAGEDPIWFACAPVGKGLAGKALTIKANLDNGTSLVRTITLHSTVDYKANQVTSFSVNMAKAETVSNKVEASYSETVYLPVTAINSLAVDDEVIIVNSTTPTYAMTGTSSSSGLSPVAKDAATGFSLGNDGYVRLPSGSSVLILYVKTISNSSIVLRDGSNKYLASSSSGFSRTLNLSTSSQTWTLSFTNGTAKLTASNYSVGFSSNIFNLSRNGSVAIYKKGTVGTTISTDIFDDVVCNHSDYGAYLSGKNLVYDASTDQLSREYNSDGTLTFTILAPAEEQAVEFSGIPTSGITIGSSFTLQLTYSSGVTKELEKTYKVYVVKEEGHMLWLTDGAGNGFIVKR